MRSRSAPLSEKRRTAFSAVISSSSARTFSALPLKAGGLSVRTENASLAPLETKLERSSRVNRRACFTIASNV